MYKTIFLASICKTVNIFLPISFNIHVYVFGAQKSRLIKTALLSTHNISGFKLGPNSREKGLLSSRKLVRSDSQIGRSYSAKIRPQLAFMW